MSKFLAGLGLAIGGGLVYLGIQNPFLGGLILGICGTMIITIIISLLTAKVQSMGHQPQHRYNWNIKQPPMQLPYQASSGYDQPAWPVEVIDVPVDNERPVA